jgi:biotin carboxylase
VKFLVVIPGGYWQIPMIHAAKNQGFSVIVVDSNPDAVGFLHADYRIVADLHSLNEITNDIRLITNTIVGAVSFCSDIGIELAFYLNQVFQVKLQQFLDPQNFVNKSKQRKIWADAHILQPRFKSYMDINSALIERKNIKFPIVVKPADSSGSRGVTIVDQPDGFQQALIDAFSFSRSNQVIVEDFMSGVEFTVEVFAFEGIILPVLITQKTKISNGTGTVSGFLRSLSPNNPVYSPLAKLAVQAYSALGLTNGPGHLELMADLESGPVGVIEAAARGGGFGLSTKLMFEVTGFSLIDETLNSMDGIAQMPISLKYKPGALFFIPTQKGTLLSIKGLEESRAIEGVNITILATIGSAYRRPSIDADRLCAIVVTANSDTELNRKIDAVREKLRFIFND